MCAGIPIVYNDNLHTVDNIIKSYKIGFSIDVNDYENTAKQIDELVNDNDRLVKFRDNVKITREVLNWDNEKIKILNIFKDLHE